MSDEALRDAMARMSTDEAFRAAVERGEPAVLVEFDLTLPEIAVLRGLRAETAEPGATVLGQRLSKSTIFLGGTLSALHTHDTGADHGEPEGSPS